MEWMAIVGDAVQYIEAHITEELTTDDIAAAVCVSPFYFQRGFAMLCGVTVGEYIRRRRLALAGHDLAAGAEKVIDIALKYGYDSPDSFTKAFTRFHGVTPTAARQSGALLKSFAPLKIKFSLEGGYLMDYKMQNKEAFTVLGNAKRFTYEEAKARIPQFWQEHFATGKGAVVMGTYGVNMDETMSKETFEYMIADPCDAACEVPDGFVKRTIPAFTWAVFPCVGPMPTALQSVNTRIYTEWLPAMRDYAFAAGYCMEYYDDPKKYKNGTMDEKYYCEIWIPVKKK